MKKNKFTLNRALEKPYKRFVRTTVSRHTPSKPHYKRPLQRPQSLVHQYFTDKNVKRKIAAWIKLLLIVGPLLLCISFAWYANQTIQLAFFTPHVKPVAKSQAQEIIQYPIPATIKIPKVGIELPVEETTINHGVWQIADKGASHLTISANPGQEGPIILYGHNTNDRFGPIRWLSKGDSIEIKTVNGETHIYKIIQTLTVEPDKTEVFTKNSGETLILYTCDGFADLERFLVIAKPVNSN